MLKLHRAGDIELDDGHRIRLTHREVFTPSSLERWKRVKETIARLVFMAMAMVLVVPMLAIFAYVMVKAWPALSISLPPGQPARTT